MTCIPRASAVRAYLHEQLPAPVVSSRSMQMYLRIAMCLALAVLAALGQSGAPPENKDRIEQIVKEYILQHPEVLLESVRLYQERERDAQQQKSKNAMASRQPE